MKTEIAKIKNVYLMDKKKATKEKLSTWGASYFIGRIILDIEYNSGGRQSTSLNITKTALSLKKNQKVKVNIEGNYIKSIIHNGKVLKGSWLY